MKIKLYLPDESIAAIKRMGLLGAWTETGSDDTSHRVHNALVATAVGTEESVKVAKE